MFVVFEGGEGVGKSSQVRLLEKALKKRGLSIRTTKEPGGTETGRIIKRILLKKGVSPILELFLFLADRKANVDEIIKPSLLLGKIVISDRFSLSTLAYQGYGRGFPIELLQRLNKEVCNGISPERIFLIDMPEEEALLRKNKKDRFEMEEVAFHKRVRDGYLSLARKDKRIKVIDGRKTKEEIHKMVMKEIDDISL